MYNITIWVTEICDKLPKIDSIFAWYLPFRANGTGLNHEHWFDIRETTKLSTTMHTWCNRVSTGCWCSVKSYVGFFLLQSASGLSETWQGHVLYRMLSIVCRGHLQSKMIYQQYSNMILLPFKLQCYSSSSSSNMRIAAKLRPFWKDTFDNLGDARTPTDTSCVQRSTIVCCGVVH